jgi:hypothetical protein
MLTKSSISTFFRPKGFISKFFVALLILLPIFSIWYQSLWSEWMPHSGFKDLSFANGKRLEAKIRTFPCLMCTSGPLREEALFSDSKKYYQKDIGKSVVELMDGYIKKNNWITVCCGHNEYKWLFSQVRVFVPSVEPLIVIVMPWHYKSANLPTFTAKDVSDEASAFYGQARTPTFYAFDWPDEIRNIVEIRSTLPPRASRLVLISKQTELEVSVPDRVGEVTETRLPRLLVRFERMANNEVSVQTIKTTL